MNEERKKKKENNNKKSRDQKPFSLFFSASHPPPLLLPSFPIMAMNQQQKDIVEERARASFPTRKMSYFIYNGEALVHRLEKATHTLSSSS